MLYAVNPVGVGSLLVSRGLSILVFFGAFGDTLKPYSPIVAVVLAPVLPPVLVATKGRYYLRRTGDGIDISMFVDDGNPTGATLTCHVCTVEYERPDLVSCEAHADVICSRCLSTDRTGEHVLPAETAVTTAV